MELDDWQRSVELRLARQNDLHEIETLKYRYAAYCDAGYDLDGLCSLFVQDGRWAAEGYGDFTGHQAIREFFSQMAQSVTDVLHFVTSPRIDIADDGLSATGRFYLMCVCKSRRRKEPEAIDPVLIFGTYSDRFRKVDGRWFFEELLVEERYSKRFRTPQDTT